MNRRGRRTAAFVAVAVAAALATAASTDGAAAAPPPETDGTSHWTTTVELAAEDADALDAALAEATSRGATVLGTAPGVALVDLTIGTAAAVVAGVTGVEVRSPVTVDVRPDRTSVPEFGPTVGSAVGITLADAWHAAGIDGTGIRIGVIDFFDTAYWDVAEHGPLPRAGVDARCFDQGRDCSDEFFDGKNLGGEEHGVAIVEILRDMAPGADILIGQANTLSDYQALVDWFVSEGVTVVTRSLGARYDGPGDGRGPLDEIAENAVARGITWINSSGNNGRGQYYRHPVRLIGDRVAFGSTGTDTFLRLNRCAALGGVRWSNDWDLPASERSDYDLVVWESPTGAPGTGRVVARSQRRQTSGATPIEWVDGTYCPASGSSLYLEVQYLAGDITGDVLEILDYGDGFAAHTQAAYSAAVPIVDADVAGVVAVGAVDPPDSGTIGFYSSQGPTNDGRTAPDVVAPSGFGSSVYDGPFSGTSAAAPVVAGAAALLLDAGVAVSGVALGNLVRNATVDRGATGPDNVYGYGQFVLPAPPASEAAAVPSRYVALPGPLRFLDTRPSSAVGPATLVGRLRAGEIRSLPIAGQRGIPENITSVAINLTNVEPDRRGFVQALPLWESELGAFSTLNADAPGQVRGNFAIVPVAEDGTISLYSIAPTDLVVDVLGWFEPTSDPVRAGRLVRLSTAQRLVDTRSGGAARLPSGSDVLIPGLAGVPPSDVAALVVTVIAVDPTTRGWLQAFPRQRADVVGTTATVNFGAGENVANTAIVPVTGGGAAVRTLFSAGGSGHVVVDAVGYITSADADESASGRFVALTPTRAFDSRQGQGYLDTGVPVVVDATGAGVPDGAGAVIWNLTIVDPLGRGHARGWADGAAPPPTSLLNWIRAQETRAAAAVTAVSPDGRAQFRLQDGRPPGSGALGHLTADVFGYVT